MEPGNVRQSSGSVGTVLHMWSQESSIIGRIRAVDWRGKPEPTICSQLIMPVLGLLGYGEHTMHKLEEQQSYTLKDPYLNKGSRRIRLDYQPRVYEQGLWVMEAKGTEDEVAVSTLGQVRDYAIHPEVRASLVVTVDAAGFRVFDPWTADWDIPFCEVPLAEVADRIAELRAVLGVEFVADVVRRRHFDHLRTALSTSLEFAVLQDAEAEFRTILDEARKSIDERRRAVQRDAWQQAEDLHERVLRNSGVYGVVLHHNTPWIGSTRSVHDFSRAVLLQEERQRPTQILSVRRAVEAVFQQRIADGAPAWRPLWWVHVIVLAGAIELRGQPGCEPYATDLARHKIRDTILRFPDDPVDAATWEFQRVLIPNTTRMVGLAPLEEMAATARAQQSPEARIRLPMNVSWFFGHLVRNSVIAALAAVDPWTPENLARVTSELAAVEIPKPGIEWPGPMGDEWLDGWKATDRLLEMGLWVLSAFPGGDDLLDDEIRHAAGEAARGNDGLLKRAASPLATRLGLVG